MTVTFHSDEFCTFMVSAEMVTGPWANVSPGLVVKCSKIMGEACAPQGSSMSWDVERRGVRCHVRIVA